MNRNGELSRSLSSIAKAGVEAERPSRRKERRADQATRVSRTRMVDAGEDSTPQEQTPTKLDRTDPTLASATLQTRANVY